MARNVLFGVLGLWGLWAALFIARSPVGAFNHDMQGHIQYTRILYNERRLPLPREGWETYQPPLYYLINCLFLPNSPIHAFCVRLVSVLYGALALWLMGRELGRFGTPLVAQAVVLTFIATTPAFLFMFTTYNNDALATLLSIAILTVAAEWASNARLAKLFLLGVLSTAGFYTKLSVTFPLVAIAIVIGALVSARKIALQRWAPVLMAMALGALTLTPWLIHNYRLTGELTPVPADFPLYAKIQLPQSPVKTFFTPPGVSAGEWRDPYAHLWEETGHKKNSFWAYLFVTSVFGEFTFEFLPVVVPWVMLLLHATVGAIAFGWGIRRSSWCVVATALIILGLVGQASLLFRAPYAGQMDFRYVAWIWLPVAVLSAAALPRQRLLEPLLVAGTVVHSVFWAVLVAGGRWNIPW